MLTAVYKPSSMRRNCSSVIRKFIMTSRRHSTTLIMTCANIIPLLCNAYSLKENLKGVEQHLNELRLARRCSQPDCSKAETLHSSRKMEHYRKSDHGQPKDLQYSQHLTCKHKTTQHNDYKFTLHLKRVEIRLRSNVLTLHEGTYIPNVRFGGKFWGD